MHHAGKPQNTLPVVQLEDAADAGVPLLQQMLGSQVSAAFVVVPDYRTGQLRITAVQKYHGHPGIPQLPVQVQIGIGQRRLGALHDHAPHRMLQQLKQYFPLLLVLVVRSVDQSGEAVFQQHLLGVHQQGRENIAVGKTDDDGDGIVLRLGLPLQHHGSAALAALDQALLGQDFKGIAHRLAADAELLHELLLRGQAAA